MPQHSLTMGTGDSPAPTVCSQITQGKSVPSIIQGQPQPLEDQQEHTQLIRRNTQGTLRRDLQEKISGKNVLKEVPALHGMMECAWRSSVSGSMCALNVQEITGGPCVIWALALWKRSTRTRDESDVNVHQTTTDSLHDLC